ncbi:MAG TPA: NAD(P)/FAD-dependent oxidoreductase [Anaerolineae bacterium]|nr:NAD(P)/FAD-dependent oxidoreductase [Anaerolineae bacterium]
MPKIFDLVVIGGGPAGSEAATNAAALGKRVALIEEQKLGGTCLNYGCDPTDTLLHIAQMLYSAQTCNPYGLHVSHARADWKSVQAYVRRVMKQIRGGSVQEANRNLKAQGITFIQGKARFVSPHTVEVKGREVRGKNFVIATGVKNVVPPIPGLEDAGYITHREAVSLPTLPRRMAIIGSMPMAMEFAQLFHRFGVQVTVLEPALEILAGEDRELAQRLMKILEGEGVRFEVGVMFDSVTRVRKEKIIQFHCPDEPIQKLVVDEILVMVGRRPILDELNLEAAGVEYTDEGITINATGRTTVPHIWAAGDVTGGAQFSSRAADHGRFVVRNVFSKKPQPFEEPLVPWIISTDPAIAHLGKAEEDLWQEGVTFRVGKLELGKIDRAIMNGESDGLVKLLADEEGHLLGAHILARNAGDMLAPAVIVMRQGLTVDALADAILPYPVMSDAVRWAADQLVEKDDG